MALPEYPVTRTDQYLNNIATGEGTIPEYPITREDQYLDEIARNGTAAEREIREEVGTLSEKIADVKSDVSAMKSIGRFLSVWDCTTGLPQTDPQTLPFTYETGDYYRVGVVADAEGTNYKPSGTTYTGSASTVVESGDPALGDLYVYDGTGWTLLKGAVLLDAAPVEGSTNAITSGAVFTALSQIYTKQELAALAETWTFTIEDGTTVNKKVVILP